MGRFLLFCQVFAAAPRLPWCKNWRWPQYHFLPGSHNFGYCCSFLFTCHQRWGLFNMKRHRCCFSEHRRLQVKLKVWHIWCFCNLFIYNFIQFMHPIFQKLGSCLNKRNKRCDFKKFANMPASCCHTRTLRDNAFCRNLGSFIFRHLLIASHLSISSFYADDPINIKTWNLFFVLIIKHVTRSEALSRGVRKGNTQSTCRCLQIVASSFLLLWVNKVWLSRSFGFILYEAKSQILGVESKLRIKFFRHLNRPYFLRSEPRLHNWQIKF